MDFYTIFVVLTLTLCSVQTYSELVRDQRNIPRDKDKPITIQELRNQCTERGWGQCREAIDFLYDKSSKFNREQIKCQSETDKNSISIVGDSGSDLLLSSGCPHRIESRTKYCDYARTIAEESQEAVVRSVFSLENLKNCSVVAKTPAEISLNENIISMFNAWINDITLPRKFAKNCAPCNENLKDLPRQTFSSSIFDSKSKKLCDHLNDNTIQKFWEVQLTKLAKLMRANDLLDKLGRQRKGCLRGCVKTDKVECIHYALKYDPLKLNYNFNSTSLNSTSLNSTSLNSTSLNSTSSNIIKNIMEN